MSRSRFSCVTVRGWGDVRFMFQSENQRLRYALLDPD